MKRDFVLTYVHFIDHIKLKSVAGRLKNNRVGIHLPFKCTIFGALIVNIHEIVASNEMYATEMKVTF